MNLTEWVAGSLRTGPPYPVFKTIITCHRKLLLLVSWLCWFGIFLRWYIVNFTVKYSMFWCTDTIQIVGRAEREKGNLRMVPLPTPPWGWDHLIAARHVPSECGAAYHMSGPAERNGHVSQPRHVSGRGGGWWCGGLGRGSRLSWRDPGNDGSLWRSDERDAHAVPSPPLSSSPLDFFLFIFSSIAFSVPVRDVTNSR